MLKSPARAHQKSCALLCLIALSGCQSNADSNVTAGAVSGTTAGAVSGTTAGTMAGTMAGIMAGTAAGTAAGIMAGTAAGTAAGTLAGTAAGTAAGTMAGAAAGTMAGTMAGAAPLTPISDCVELNDPAALTCFANADCEEGRRCQNLGTADYATPCCVLGARGATPPGGACAPETGELECTSALCITQDDPSSGLCSGVCETDADCPASLPRCLSISFSGSELMFCSPAAP